MPVEKARFGAGCFWGVEMAFRQTPGVRNTTVGYAGGHTVNPTYQQVCGHGTGHAEVVEVEFDSAETSYAKLLDVFFDNHDPTQLNRQGPDVGTQYRSVIFCFSPEQEQLARQAMAARQSSGKYARPIVTEIQPAGLFYRAEEYHQQYLGKRGLTSCHV